MILKYSRGKIRPTNQHRKFNMVTNSRSCTLMYNYMKVHWRKEKDHNKLLLGLVGGE